jgi:hypothetical protein
MPPPPPIAPWKTCNKDVTDNELKLFVNEINMFKQKPALFGADGFLNSN